MTAKIFEFKKSGELPRHHRIHDRLIEPTKIFRIKNNQEIFQEVYEFVIDDWQRHAVKNRLNEFIFSKLPHYARGSKDADYVNDLNVLSYIENKLEMKVAIFYPGCTKNNPLGWLVAFHREDEIYATPADMSSEANARALNILFYLGFITELQKIGRV